MKIREYYKNREKITITAVFLITVIIACSPLFSRYCINGHDLEYHLLRIESLKEGIRMGRPFLKVNTLFFGNAGYASSMFYPDFLLYIPALLRVMGLSINISYNSYVAICIILCYLSAYYSTKGMTGSSFGGMVAAVTLTLSRYHLDDIYIRGAVGEYTAFIFIPLIIYALFNIVSEKMDKPWLFVLSYFGLLLSHTSTFFMCAVFGVVTIILYSKKTLANRKVLARLVVSTMITLLLSCFYWLPMAEQFLSTRFYVSTPWMQPKDEAVRFFEIFTSSFPALGCICILILIPRIFLNKKAGGQDGNKEILLGFADFLMIAGSVFAFCACDLLPWERIGRYLSFIQFPWRFFILSSTLFSMAAGILYAELTGIGKENGKISIKDKQEFLKGMGIEEMILTVLLIINGISAFNNLGSSVLGYYDYSNDYYTYKPYTANVIAGEWLPETVRDKESLVDDSELMLSDNGKAIDFSRIKNTIEADINDNFGYADVPFIYYLGYRAEIVKEDGSRVLLKVTGEGNNGMCRVYLKDMGKGRLKVYYKGTVISVISVWVSLTSLVVLILVLYVKKSYRLAGK